MTREEKILHTWEARFAPPDPTVYRTTPSTPLAPPPIDERKQDFRSALKTESPTKTARAGFVVDGFGQRKVKRDAKRRALKPIFVELTVAEFEERMR